MKLSKEQGEKLLIKLTEIGKSQCSICGSSTLSISDTIFELREFQGGSIIIGKEQNIYPVIAINCPRCGNTFFLNAIIAGVIENKN